MFTYLYGCSVQRGSHPLHTELNVKFERLGIRILRKLTEAEQTPFSSTRVISKITLYGLTVEGTVGTDVLIQGQLEGIRAADLTPAGKKYSDILLMGTGCGPNQEATPTKNPSDDPAKTSLSFSISRSPQPMRSPMLSQQFSDVHLNIFVPTIQYTHSINFVYEMEIFVSEFKSYSTMVSDSFKTAAVGVAKGLVSKENQLAKGLSKLHISFGRSLSQAHQSFTSEDFSDTEEIDAGELPSVSKDRMYFNFSIQSPVIVLPKSLKKEDCLIAHLGEIAVSNEFISPQEEPTSFAPSSSTIDRLMISISRVSLHATRDEGSRRDLLSGCVNDSVLSRSGKCFKVLKETSAMLQVDKQLGLYDNGNHGDENGRKSAELVITGKICDPLLVKLPKEVFDQIQSTLKYGIRRKPPKSEICTEASSPEGSHHKDDTQGSDTNSADPLPSIFASFSLPKLSLELRHTLEGKEKNLVYVSFDGFSVQCSKVKPYVMDFDLSLRNIIIEDLLQPEHSDYRYILASSIKPLTIMSPVSTPGKNLGNLSVSTNLPSLSRHLFPLSQLMSTPKPPVKPVPSPLRSFEPHSEGGLDGVEMERGEGSLREEVDRDESGSTLVEGSVKEDDLLTISALYADKKCPDFATSYKSVS